MRKCVVKNEPDEVVARPELNGEAMLMKLVEHKIWTERMVEALRRGGPEGGRWSFIHDKVFIERTLRLAYAQVLRNGGGPGVDGMTVGKFGEKLDEEIGRLLESWRLGEYQPHMIRRSYIAKAGSSEKRPLGIPTVRDRVVQAAVRMILEPIFEQDFSSHSYGFRPGRSAHDALKEVTGLLKDGKVWVVDADLKGYFDSIPHDALLEKVHRRVTDRRVLGLLEQFLQAGIMEDGEEHEPEAGTPQGGVISPLLANIYLNDLDHLMEQSGRSMVRYADDFVILCHSQEEAEAALEVVRSWTVKSGLTLHPAKTRLVDMGQPGNHFDFLGFRLKHDPENKPGDPPRILRLVRPKSLDKLKAAVRSKTKRTSGKSMKSVIKSLNQTLRGWSEYFRSVGERTHRTIDAMTRRRLRAMLAKRQGRTSWGGGLNNYRWKNAFFSRRGLFSLEVAHVRFIRLHSGNR